MTHFFIECKLAPNAATDLDAVRHGLETVYDNAIWRESYSPNCWLTRKTPAAFRLHHDGPQIGYVSSVVAYKEWHYATAVIDDTPLTRDLVRVGAKVSLGGRSIRRDENELSRCVRHTICTLDEIALVRAHEVPGLAGAAITRVSEAPKPKPTPPPPKRKPQAADRLQRQPAPPRRDRYLTESEITTLNVLAREFPVDMLAQLLRETR